MVLQCHGCAMLARRLQPHSHLWAYFCTKLPYPAACLLCSHHPHTFVFVLLVCRVCFGCCISVHTHRERRVCNPSWILFKLQLQTLESGAYATLGCQDFHHLSLHVQCGIAIHALLSDCSVHAVCVHTVAVLRQPRYAQGIRGLVAVLGG